MGFSVEDLSSSTSDSFQLHSVVQCCCSGKCCADNIVIQEIPCHLCDGTEEPDNNDEHDNDVNEKVTDTTLKVCQRYALKDVMLKIHI